MFLRRRNAIGHKHTHEKTTDNANCAIRRENRILFSGSEALANETLKTS
ncbi:MAG: hypothetical protein J6W69_05065 [Bacteroidales bacterium]|nr:hypothetical protein [Bacteroidales bacterium]